MSISSIAGLYGSRRGAVRTGFLRGGGSAAASAWRTAAVDSVFAGELADGQAIDSRVVADVAVQLHS